MNTPAGLVLLLAAILFTQVCLAFWNEFEIISITNFNQTDDNPVCFQYGVKRIDRRTFGVTGEVRIKEYEHLMVEAKAYHQASQNADYKPLMYKLDRTSSCEYLNKYYVPLLQKELREPVSDFPQFDGPSKELCTVLRNRTWHIHNFVFDSSKIPQFFQVGMYKLVFAVYDGDGDEVVSGSEYLIRLY